MNSKVETTNTWFDTIKLTLAVCISIAVIVAFYVFNDRSIFFRWIGLLTGAGALSRLSQRGFVAAAVDQ